MSLFLQACRPAVHLVWLALWLVLSLGVKGGPCNLTQLAGTWNYDLNNFYSYQWEVVPGNASLRFSTTYRLDPWDEGEVILDAGENLITLRFTKQGMPVAEKVLCDTTVYLAGRRVS